MKRLLHSITLLCLILFTGNLALAQPKLASGFKYYEEAFITLKTKDSYNTTVEFMVFEDSKVISHEGAPVPYKAGDIIGFTLKKSGKHFLSGSQGKLAQPQIVEDLTPDLKQLKVVKAFLPNTPLVQKDSVVMGSWLHYVLVVKDDGSNQIISGFKKIAEFVKTDCPELSKKILAKEKGYFLGMLAGTPAEELEIYHRIAAEFDQCKK